jgi:branched-chain amino acid transport system ATP-binding protein
VLRIQDLVTSYGKIEALKGISLDVSAGEIVALIGANGAGKSTTLKTVSGLLRPAGGSILLEGEAIHTLAPEAIVSRGIVQVLEGRKIFPKLSVLENLEVGAYGRKGHGKETRKEDLEQVFQLFPRLKERRDQQGGSLSGGEQQMLAIGRGLMARPKLLLLDEPSLGLAPVIIEEIFQLIANINRNGRNGRNGVTVLLVEQDAQAALEISNRGYVLETGRIAFSGTGQDLLHHEKVIEAYLGGKGE